MPPRSAATSCSPPARETIGAPPDSAHTNDPAVRERAGSLDPADYDRDAPAAARREAQRARVALPDLPTTTIGSYPADAPRSGPRGATCATGRIDEAAYERFLEGQIAHVIEVQEGLGLDVLVHGEPERNDMVEYFGQQLARVRLLRERLGAVLRQPLREAADPLRRRLPAGADDRALVAPRAVAHATSRSRACSRDR